MSDALVQFKEARSHLSTALEKQTNTLTQLLPADMPVDRFRQVVMSAIARDPTLLTCDMGSMVRAVVQAAECGLYIGGTMGEAYLVPFWNTKRRRREVQFVPGYRGFIKRALDDERVLRIEAECVYNGDEFQWAKGTAPELRHVPCKYEDRVSVDKLTHAYAVAFMVHGQQFEVLDRTQLDAIRSKSKARNKQGDEVGPWSTDTLAMYRKCPIRSLFRFLPLTPRASALLSHDRDEPAMLARSSGERTQALKARLGAPVDAPSHPLDEIDPEEVDDEPTST